MMLSTLFSLNSVLSLWILLGFCLPGLTSVTYCRKTEASTSCKAEITLYMNQLNTEKSNKSYEYDHFDFCPISEEFAPVAYPESFGELKRPGPYKIEFLRDIQCEKFCTRMYRKNDSESERRMDTLKKGISLDCLHRWIVDDMPVKWCYLFENKTEYCSDGFPMGCFGPPPKNYTSPCSISNRYNKPDHYYLFNHVNLTITTAIGEWGEDFGVFGGRILSIKIEPASLNHHDPNGKLDCSSTAEPLSIPEETDDQNINITYTYSVKFLKKYKYSPRRKPQESFKWHLVLVPLLIVLVPSGIIAVWMLRKLKKDFARYNQMDCGKDVQEEEFDWKMVHGDVFRTPRNEILLAVFLGSGTQVFCMSLVILWLIALSSRVNNRHGFIYLVMVLYVVFSIVSGYVSARISKSFGGANWKSNALLTSTICPGFVFGIYFVVNSVLLRSGKSRDPFIVPFETFIAFIGLWLCVSVPLTLFGSYLGFRKGSIEHPVRTDQINQMPRQIPDHPIYKKPIFGIILGSVLSFGCNYVQIYFITINSGRLPHNSIYHFSMFVLVFFSMVILCSLTAILLCYLQLCDGDYHWWWRPFLTSGCMAFYLYLHCCFYFAFKIPTNEISWIITYFGSLLIAAFLYFLITGTIGFMACFWFVRKIYRAVKVD